MLFLTYLHCKYITLSKINSLKHVFRVPRGFQTTLLLSNISRTNISETTFPETFKRSYIKPNQPQPDLKI